MFLHSCELSDGQFRNLKIFVGALVVGKSEEASFNTTVLVGQVCCWTQIQRVKAVIHKPQPVACPHFNVYNCKHIAKAFLVRRLFDFLCSFFFPLRQQHHSLVVHGIETLSDLFPHSRSKSVFYNLLPVRYKSLPPPHTTGQTHNTHSHSRCVCRQNGRAFQNAAARGLSSIQKPGSESDVFCSHTQTRQTTTEEEGKKSQKK